MSEPKPSHPRGRLGLQTAWIISCGKCRHQELLMTCADPNPKDEAGPRQMCQQIARLRGWTFDPKRGWTCPECVAREP